MKKTFLLVTLLGLMGLSSTVSAQETELVTKKATALSRNYLRPSISKIYISDGNSIAAEAIASLKTVNDEKFDANPLKNDVFVMNDIPGDKKERATAVKSFVEGLMVSEKIPNQIMHTWFPADNNGDLSYDVLVERGQYAATDRDVMVSNNSKRTSMLNELGEKLIDRSYIVAYVITTSTYQSKDGQTMTNINGIPYVFKLDFNEEVMEQFYNSHYTVKGIDEMSFPIKHVMSGKSGASIITANEAAGDYDNIMTIITKKVADFQVKSPITYTHPIRANIGKKEGVKCDKRYSVMRMVQTKDGEQKAQRVATLRATNKVFDNRSIADGVVAEEEQTKFYEIKGRKVIPGETIVENPDFGINVFAEYTISEASIGVEYRIGKLLHVPGLLAYMKFGMPWSKGLGGIKISAFDENGEDKSFQVFDGSIGIAKEFNFAGTFAVTPSVEAGYLIAPGAKGDFYDVDDVSGNILYNSKAKDYDTKSYKVGAHIKLGYYVTRNIQLYVNAGYNYYIKSKQFEALQEYWRVTESKREKFQYFQPLAIGAGLKFSF